MHSRDIIKLLEAAGWRKVSQKGSHVQFKRNQGEGRVTVKHPDSDVPVGTQKSIEKQSGVKLRN